MNYLLLLPILALIGMFWFFGSKIFIGTFKDDTQYYDVVSLFTQLDKIEVNLEFDETEVQDALRKIIGKKILRIYYANLNPIDKEFEGYDFVDSGIFIEFEGGEFFNWVYETDLFNSNTNIYMDCAFFVSFEDVLSKSNLRSQLQDVSGSLKWKDLINAKVSKADLVRREINGFIVCEKFILESESGGKVGVYSTNEPSIVDEDSVEVDMSFELNWTTITFGKEVQD